MLISNGAMIHNDIIEAFDKAVANPENINTSGGIDWDYVDADINIDLNGVYSSEYLYECLEALVDNYYASV